MLLKSSLFLLFSIFVLSYSAIAQDSLILATSRPVMLLQADHSDAAFSADSKLLAYGDRKGFVTIFDLERQSQLFRSQWTEEDPIIVTIFSMDGKRLFAGTESGALIEFDVENLNLVASHQPHRKKLKALAVSKDGSHLYTGSSDETIRIWELPNLNSPKKILHPGIGRIHSMVLLDDENKLWIASEHVTKGPVQLDATNGDILKNFDLGNVNDIAWLPEQRKLAVARISKKIHFIESNSMDPKVYKKAHNGTINGVGAWPGTPYFATCADDNRWILRKGDGTPVYTLDGGSDLYNFNISPNGRYLALQISADELRVFDLSKMNLPARK